MVYGVERERVEREIKRRARVEEEMCEHRARAVHRDKYAARGAVPEITRESLAAEVGLSFGAEDARPVDWMRGGFAAVSWNMVYYARSRGLISAGMRI